jgi:transmembrane sensor
MNQDDRAYREAIRAAAEWISRIESGELKDPQAFTQWLSEDDARQNAARELMQVTRALRSLTPADWAEVKGAVESRPINVLPLRLPEQARLEHPARSLRPPRPLRSVGIVIVAALVVGVLVVAPMGAWPKLYTADVGERVFVPLEDGSTVELNTRTRIEIHYGPHVREVRLMSGEAVFDVKHDPWRPFRVSSGSTAVQDVGTKFVVRRGADGTTTVTVLEGRAEVRTAGRKETVEADEVATVGIHGSTARIELERLPQQEIDRRMSWQNGVLVFQGQTLSEAVREVNR